MNESPFPHPKMEEIEKPLIERRQKFRAAMWDIAIGDMVSDALDSGADAALVLRAVGGAINKRSDITVDMTFSRGLGIQTTKIETIEQRRHDG